MREDTYLCPATIQNYFIIRPRVVEIHGSTFKEMPCLTKGVGGCMFEAKFDNGAVMHTRAAKEGGAIAQGQTSYMVKPSLA